MTKLGNKIRNVLGDITVEDLIVCPIDDHMTLGVQNVKVKIQDIKYLINDKIRLVTKIICAVFSFNHNTCIIK
mgnify:CR=1 FL=1